LRKRNIVRADSGEETETVTAELEAVAAAVEKLRQENEELKVRLNTTTPTKTPFKTKEQWSSFEYPPITTDGRTIYGADPTLINHEGHLSYRWSRYCELRGAIDANEGGLEKFSRGYELYGFTKSVSGITYREWAPGAQQAALVGDFNGWNETSHMMNKNDFGTFEICLPNNEDGTAAIEHGSRVKIRMQGQGGDWFYRIPAWIKFSVQPVDQILYDGIYYDPPVEEQYVFKHARPSKPKAFRIYECHVGMSSPEPKINTYLEFARDVLPRVKDMGYNAIQIMAIQEHAFYASFGYHVNQFFASSSRCGTPDELKYMIDEAHRLGLTVLMDVVHSHASNNVEDGLNMFDGSDTHYFHAGERGYHWMWDSRLFNYGQWETIRFLLSNLRWWVEEYKFDGFRFDGVTSMMYTHHGLQMAFTGDYGEYFGMATDVDCMSYLMLANDMLHTLYPNVTTIAEDVSGMPTLCLPVQDGGVGFDYRLQMAIADKMIEVVSEWGNDETWDLGNIIFTMENRRWNEPCIGYCESHDQALVGDKTLAFWMIDADMYDHMSTVWETTERVNRGIALHKMFRLLTLTLGGNGYLTFMGNEFGHPEWIDFPRGDRTDSRNGKFIPGNGNSYDHARRRFDLADMDHLRYRHMNQFEKAMNWMEEKYQSVANPHQYVSKKTPVGGDNIIVYEKGDLVFVFNFHPTNSYTDYRVGCLNKCKYKIVLNSDREIFGGWENVNEEAEFFADDFGVDGRPHSFMVYAPSRTVVVYGPADYADPLDELCDENPSAIECKTYD